MDKSGASEPGECLWPVRPSPRTALSNRTERMALGSLCAFVQRLYFIFFFWSMAVNYGLESTYTTGHLLLAGLSPDLPGYSSLFSLRVTQHLETPHTPSQIQREALI